MPPTTVSLVGSTGSIGTQAVQVIEANPDRFSVVALAAHRSIEVVIEQAKRLHPDLVAVGEPGDVAQVEAALGSRTEVVAGPEGLVAAASLGDVVLNGVVGFAGLPVTLAALSRGARLALANKESLIAGAPVVQRARLTSGAEIIPVDSEHCAIHQCLAATPGPESVSRLLVTASGGPFRGRTKAELRLVGVDDALAHPTWQMGPKITIDSSTLMNKGLEVIEAHELFGLSYDRIDVVVHPQSIIHSMVELVDGATVAQLSNPDMRLPIGYALAYPERLGTPFGAIDWTTAAELTFEPPDRSVFTCLDLAYRAGRHGGGAPAWLNAANEIAVEAFLAGRLTWLGIADVVTATLDQFDDAPMNSVDDVLAADAAARRQAQSAVLRQEAA